jgi:hypothetical protein
MRGYLILPYTRMIEWRFWENMKTVWGFAWDVNLSENCIDEHTFPVRRVIILKLKAFYK